MDLQQIEPEPQSQSLLATIRTFIKLSVAKRNRRDEAQQLTTAANRPHRELEAERAANQARKS